MRNARRISITLLVLSAALLTIALLSPTVRAGFVPRVFAHCDTLGGPVIADARAALDKGDVTPVLKWVTKDDEPAIKDAFDKTFSVRKLSPEARDLADMYFFETLVRIHRAGEGAPYTGLKPAGEVEPIVAAADRAIDTKNADDLTNEMTKLVADGIRERFTRVVEAKGHANDSVDAGREYVEAYVQFVHYVERLHGDAANAAGHDAEAEGAAPQHAD